MVSAMIGVQEKRIPMRLMPLPAALSAAMLALPLLAQPLRAQPAAAPPPGAAPASPDAASPAIGGVPPADPVVARVNGQALHLSELEDLAQSLPPQARGLPQRVLYPILLNQLIDREALIEEARKEGLQKDPAVQHQMQTAADAALQDALISREVSPQITEAAIRARYEKEIANKPGEPEVKARQILLPTEAQADKVIAELKGGADFAALAKQYSTDPSGQQGGDLGYFKKADMLPEFSEAAFALKPGQIADKPVHSRYGWHVIQVEAVRQAPPPSFAEVHDQLRQKMIQDAVRRAILQARTDITIEMFNPDGSPMRPTDNAQPPGMDAPGADPGAAQ
jgi:peptidyl-prolyl cis-trans isomerase C